MSERGLRKYSTNHLCGKGYWVWMIPLSSGPISIGIVADPRFHPYEEMKTLDEALDWIRRHEPQLGESLDGRLDQVEDFLKVEDFSYGCKQCYSGDGRWTLVGEAGAFLDPFYSPGSDFIAISNTLIDRPDHAGPRRRGRDRAGQGPQRPVPEHLPGQPDPVRGAVRVLAQPDGDDGQDLRQQHPVLGHRVPAVLPRQVHGPRVHGVGAARPRADLGDHPRSSRRCTASGMCSRTASGGGRSSRRRRSPGCSSATSTWPATSTTTAFAQARRDRRHDGGVRGDRLPRAAQNLGDAAPGEDEKINPYAVSLDPDRWEADGLLDGRADAGRGAPDRAGGLANLFLEAVAQPV